MLKPYTLHTIAVLFSIKIHSCYPSEYGLVVTKPLEMGQNSWRARYFDNLAPSDVNKMLDGSTYPGWKLGCF